MAIYDVDGHTLSESGSMFANVLEYGAFGDGEHDDAGAIQDALDALSSAGGVIYFPAGTYAIKSAVKYYSNQTLFFEFGASLTYGKRGMDNLMRSYCDSAWTGYNGTHNVLIYGATFDGGTYTDSNTMLGMAHCKDITIERCTFKSSGGAWHNMEINSSCNVKVLFCDFEASRKENGNSEMLQIDAASSSTVYPWDSINTDSTGCKYIEIAGCHFHDSLIPPGIGNHAGGSHNFIRIHDNIFENFKSNSGGNVSAIRFTSGSNIDFYCNTFYDCDSGIGSAGLSYYVFNNRFVDVGTPIANGLTVKHCNMINGSYTE